MGNTVVWKPASTAALSAHYVMQIFHEAGLPDGVINFVYGAGARRSATRRSRARDLAGIHFTGSTAVFQAMWQTVGENIAELPQLPAHRRRDGRQGLHLRPPSADVDGARRRDRARRASSTRGRSARRRRASYVPRTLWPALRERARRARSDEIKMGDVADFRNFMGAVIDERVVRDAQRGHRRGARRGAPKIARRRRRRRSEGWFVRADAWSSTDDPSFKLMQEEIFGPVVTVVRLPRRRSGTRRSTLVDDDGALRADRRGLRARPRRGRRSAADALPPRGRQLLHQRQADRRGRRPAAVRRRARLGHERQGGLDVEPHPLGHRRGRSRRRSCRRRDYRYPFLAPDEA